ncbi:hypothetical protein HanIR_Chr11g0525511 [Helianthus annuus]|nr:hypothetical protein HanIR_Chr11g0525511 [Helianthus annuus]
MCYFNNSGFTPKSTFVMETWVLSQYIYYYKMWCFTLIKYFLTTVMMKFPLPNNDKHRYHHL